MRGGLATDWTDKITPFSRLPDEKEEFTLVLMRDLKLGPELRAPINALLEAHLACRGTYDSEGNVAISRSCKALAEQLSGDTQKAESISLAIKDKITGIGRHFS